MNILASGCSGDSVGAYMRSRLEEMGHKVFGVGLEGPEFCINMNEIVDRGACETMTSVLYHDACTEMEGPIDAVLCHAGITEMAWIEDHTVDKLLEILNVNLVLPFCMMKGLVQQTKREVAEVVQSRGGVVPPRRIVATSSLGARMALRTSTGYCASKAGLEALVRGVAKECGGRYPITVLGVAPGAIQGTTMDKQVIEGLMRVRKMSREEAILYSDQSGRKATFEEIWKVYKFAIFDAPEYMSGSIITMSNGLGI